jgi:acetoacetyl-CoA synthetase
MDHHGGPGELLWEPPQDRAAGSRLRGFMDWLGAREGLDLPDHTALHTWSIGHLDRFWAAVWDHFGVQASSPYDAVLAEDAMPGARWFPGARLNWAEHMLRYADTAPDEPAVLAYGEEPGEPVTLTWAELRDQSAALAAHLRAVGVRPGDRVVAYLPNIPQAVVGVLASASVGATWACCSPDFGADGATSRLQQLEPTVLLTGDGYHWNGRVLDRRDVAASLREALPTLRDVVYVDHALPGEPPPAALGEVTAWADVVARAAEPAYEQVPFDHPLWVLFSSGTTGLPKGLVHGHGGILLEHLKWLGLYADARPGDRMFMYTSTGWMMWNALLAGLLHGSTLVLFEGSPTHPDPGTLWRVCSESRARIMMLGAGLIQATMKSGVEPASSYDFSALATIGVTGSPLPTEGYRWVYAHVSPDVRLDSLSGGTDVCSAFVGGNELLPVRAGEISGVLAGVAAAAWSPDGRPLVDEVGELVVTRPMPSMPVSFWNDPDGQRYLNAYFDTWPGVWRHGDWVTVTSRGSVVIHGRSDATLNRQGVRMGSGEFYDVLEAVPEVAESLVIGVELPDGGYHLPLFVVPAPGATVDVDHLRRLIRAELSPRHVPDEVVLAPGVPHTLSGKRLEVPVKRLYQGVPLEKACNLGTVDDPDLMRWYADRAAAFRS